MSIEIVSPTPYPEVNAVLNVLLPGVRSALEDQFVGMYLYGSLASGGFDIQTSDIDFVVVTNGELPEEMISAVETLHMQLTASGLKCLAKLEGTYIPQSSLRCYTPDDTPRPTLNEGRFYLAPHGYDWVIQRHILREHGVIVDGPPLQLMIDPVQGHDLRQAVVKVLNEWWAPMIDDPNRLKRSDYQAYAILSMCRALHTLEFGVIASKQVAANWAHQTLSRPWTEIIEQALAWRPGMSLDLLHASVDLIRYTVEVAKA